MADWVSAGIVALICILCCALAGVATFMLRRSAFAQRNRLLGGMVALLVTLAIFTPWALLAAWVGEGKLAILGVVVFESIAVAMSIAIGGAFLASLPPKREPSARWARWWRSIARGWSAIFVVCALLYLMLTLAWDALLISFGGLDIQAIGETVIALLMTALAFLYARPLLRKLADLWLDKRATP